MTIRILIVIIFAGQLGFAQGLKHILEIQPPFSTSEQLGISVLGAGDVNRDGWPDLAVGARAARKTYFYWGGPGILDDIADYTIPYLGRPMKLADLNGDGIEDLILFYEDTTRIFLGKAPPQIKYDTVPDLVINPEGTGGSGGYVDAGDLNNDGFDDLVVGNGFFQGKGKVYVYMGKSILSFVPDFSADGDVIASGFGKNVKIGDITGDGIDDLVVAQQGSSSQQVNQRLDIWHGSSGFTFQKNNYAQRIDVTADSRQGMYLFQLIDYNIDGRTDIYYSDSGRAFFHWGRSDGSISYDPDFILEPDTLNGTSIVLYFSSDAYEIGDVNEDGKKDFAIRMGLGNSGCAEVFLGNEYPSVKSSGGRCRVNSAFDIISGVGDINGDGVNDFAAGAPFDGTNTGYAVIFSGNKNWITSVEQDNSQCPCGYELSQNYPNPFNPRTTIEFKLSKRSHTVLIIYDSLGREIKSMLDREFEAGVHKVEWDGTDKQGRSVATGAYFYEIIVDGEKFITKKLVVVR